MKERPGPPLSWFEGKPKGTPTILEGCSFDTYPTHFLSSWAVLLFWTWSIVATNSPGAFFGQLVRSEEF